MNHLYKFIYNLFGTLQYFTIMIQSEFSRNFGGVTVSPRWGEHVPHQHKSMAANNKPPAKYLSEAAHKTGMTAMNNIQYIYIYTYICSYKKPPRSEQTFQPISILQRIPAGIVHTQNQPTNFPHLHWDISREFLDLDIPHQCDSPGGMLILMDVWGDTKNTIP